VESGTLRLGDEVTIAPTKKKAKVEGIYIGEKSVAAAKTGENISLKFQVAVEDVQKGYVLCSPNSICQAVVEIKVQLALVDMPEHRPLFSPGYDGVMHVHTIEIEVVCTQLLSVVIDGKPLKRPFARQGQQCIAILTMPISTCMETFANLPSMGRLTLRDEGKSVAIGKILELVR
jgi:peptide chain release factor subunit 3